MVSKSGSRAGPAVNKNISSAPKSSDPHISLHMDSQLLSAQILSLIDAVLGLGVEDAKQTSSNENVGKSKADTSNSSMQAFVACIQRSDCELKAAAVLVCSCAAHSVQLLQAAQKSQLHSSSSPTNPQVATALTAAAVSVNPTVAATAGQPMSLNADDSSSSPSSITNAMLQLSRCTVGVRAVCLAKQATLLHAAVTPLLHLYSNEALPGKRQVA